MREVYEASLEPENRQQIENTYKVIRSSANLDFTEEMITELLTGAIDTHIHAGPDSYGMRPYTEADVAIKACDYGMGAVVFKCQCSASSARMAFVKQIADRWADEHGKKRIDIFSGVCLSYQVGGINPYAVETSLKLGGKYVWTPTRDASHHKKASGFTEKGIEVCDDKGDLIPQMQEILRMIAESDAILGISHQSTRERFLLIKEAKKAGVQRIVVEHPQLHITKTTIEQMKEMASMGAYLGLCYVAAVPNFISPDIDPTEVYRIIKEVGVERFVSQTDLVQVQNPDPVEGLRLFAKVLLSLGIPPKDIRTMFVDNCRAVLY